MSESHSNEIMLGKDAVYSGSYSPGLLNPIPRTESRQNLFQENILPFTGKDVWTAYELSWLNEKGKPRVAIAEFEFPFDSRAIIESKSFKYYLNSFNHTRIESTEKLLGILSDDLENASGGPVKVCLFSVDEYRQTSVPNGKCVDDYDIEINQYEMSPSLLKTDDKKVVENEKLYSHLLKSNCPVTGQPDWATLCIEYSGHKILEESLLRYVISYRDHQDFHENCVEAIFNDILTHCQCNSLSVSARYTRRGGLDINPYRTNTSKDAELVRFVRQ